MTTTAKKDMHSSSPLDRPHSDHPCSIINEEPQPSVPSTPDRSQLSTPKARAAVVLQTPPLILNTFPSPKHHLPSAPSFHSDHTPTSFDDQYQFDPLEPPAWKPPEEDEVEYVDNWNFTYNNPHHYLNGYGFNKDDSSTICSSQTNNSLSKSFGSREKPGQQILRPRGFSINSYGSRNKGSHYRHPSFGSCPQQPPPNGQRQHHRHESLPVNLFSSSSLVQSSQMFMQQQSNQNHPLLAEQEEHNKVMNGRFYKMIQPSKQNGLYEKFSHQHVSQVRADATIAGLTGALVDLYAVDRSVDEATAKMLATSDRKNVESSRKTSVGTLKDIKAILELHRVDKMVDRFKQGLQMPVFFEEEDADMTTLKELRRIDLLVGGVPTKKGKESNDTATTDNSLQNHYQFDLSEDEQEESWDQLGKGKDIIYMSTGSFQTQPEPDPFDFYDPHETAALASGGFQQSLAVTNNDLREVMDLLQCDVEIDGASRRLKEIQFVQPLLDVDRSIDARIRLAEERRCQKEMMDLYFVDVQVDEAKRTVGMTRQADTVTKAVHQNTDAKQLLSSESVIGETIEESMTSGLSPVVTKRSIFTSGEKLHSSLASAPKALDNHKANVGSSRSIFTDQEKNQGKLG